MVQIVAKMDVAVSSDDSVTIRDNVHTAAGPSHQPPAAAALNIVSAVLPGSSVPCVQRELYNCT